MKKMISCLAMLTMLASMVSCGSTESGGTSDNTVPTKAAVTTTAAETSKDEKTTTAAKVAEKSKDTTKNDTSANDETNSTLVLKEEDRLFGAYVDTQGGRSQPQKRAFPHSRYNRCNPRQNSDRYLLMRKSRLVLHKL